MASIIILTKPPTEIEYSIVDGRVRTFNFRGEKLFDEDDGTSVDGWKEKLVEIVIDQGLNINKGHGLSCFVHKMIEDGLVHEMVEIK